MTLATTTLSKCRTLCIMFASRLTSHRAQSGSNEAARIMFTNELGIKRRRWNDFKILSVQVRITSKWRRFHVRCLLGSAIVFMKGFEIISFRDYDTIVHCINCAYALLISLRWLHFISYEAQVSMMWNQFAPSVSGSPHFVLKPNCLASLFSTSCSSTRASGVAGQASDKISCYVGWGLFGASQMALHPRDSMDQIMWQLVYKWTTRADTYGKLCTNCTISKARCQRIRCNDVEIRRITKYHLVTLSLLVGSWLQMMAL